MLKLQSALLICLIISNLNLGTHSLKVIAQWKNTYPSSVIFNRMRNGLLIVGFQNSTVILDTYNPFNGSFARKICQDIMPSGSEGSSFTPVRVLGNGKIIINPVLGDKSHSRDTFIIFDPLDCSIVKTFRVAEIKERLKFLVPYHDSFDIFYKFWYNTTHEMDQTMPLRFDNTGERIETNLTCKPQNIGINELIIYRLFPIKYMDPSEGYFGQIFLRRNKTYFAKLQRFNSQFELVNKIFVDDDLEVEPSNGRIISCDSEIRNQTCEILSLDLNSERRVVIPEPYPTPIEPSSKYPVALHWSDGGFVVVHYIDKSDSVDIYLKDVSFDGSTRVLKLGNFPKSPDLYATYVALMLRDDKLCVSLEVESRTENKNLQYTVNVYCVQKQN